MVMQLKIKFIVMVNNRIQKPNLIITKFPFQIDPDRVLDFINISHTNIIVALFAVWFNYSLGKGC